MKNESDTAPDPSLACVLERFPDWRRLVESEYRRSESFRGLCEDWQICGEAKDRWAKSDAPVARHRHREYSEWLTEIEREIEEWLERIEQAGPECPENAA